MSVVWLFAEFVLCFSLYLKAALVTGSPICTPLVCLYLACCNCPSLCSAWAVHVLCLAKKSETDDGIDGLKQLSVITMEKWLLVGQQWVQWNPLGCLRSNQRCTVSTSVCFPVLGGQSLHLPMAGPALVLQLSGSSWTVCCLWGRTKPLLSCRECNYPCRGEMVISFHSLVPEVWVTG